MTKVRSSIQSPLSSREARRLVAESCGGSEVAEQLLTGWLEAGRIRWTGQLLRGDAASFPTTGPEFWRLGPRVDWEAGTARIPHFPGAPVMYGLAFEYEDVLVLLPSAPAVDPVHTGAPGRPTGAHLVVAEAERRIDAGEVDVRQGGLTQFSADLETWWGRERRRHAPPPPPLTAGTICNQVRPLWNRHLSDTRTKPRTKL